MKITEKALRAKFAALVEDGTMSAGEVDDKIMKAKSEGKCTSDPGEDEDDGPDGEEMDAAADEFRKAQMNLDDLLEKAADQVYTDPTEVRDPGGKATNVETRTPHTKTPVSHKEVDFESMDPVSIMTDICKGVTLETLDGVEPMFKAVLGQVLRSVGDLKRQNIDLTRSLATLISRQDAKMEVLAKGVTKQSRAQRKRFDGLEKALGGIGAGSGGFGGFPAYNAGDVDVVPERGERPGKGGAPTDGGGSFADTVSDWANNQIGSLRKGGSIGAQESEKLSLYRDAINELVDADDDEARAIANRIGFKA